MTRRSKRHGDGAVGPVAVKRVYDPPAPDDGARLLVDGLWPRGLRKEQAAIDEWLRDIAPSPQLRRWFGHRPERFDEFTRRYREELRDPVRAAALRRLREYRSAGPVTLLTSTRDVAHAHITVLRQVLDEQSVDVR